MKTIGIVGGVAWPSSIVYYRLINEMISARLGDGGLHSARLVLAQADFEEIERSQREGRWDRVGAILAAEGEKLRLAGADFFLLACNTVHTADRQVESSVDLPFLHIVDPTAERALAQGYSKVGLLGSRYTMSGDYFVGRLRERYGIDVIVAEGRNADAVHNALYAELAMHVFLPETREKFREAIADLVERGAEAIILGCTEFGMLVTNEDSPVPLIDTTVVHAEAAVEIALSDSEAAVAIR
jgi:aspartate racemase